MRARFLELQLRHPRLGDVRGLGPMLAAEFVEDPVTKAPAPDLATAVAEAALRRGLLILKAGIDGNCLRVLVSLVATNDQIDESLDVFAQAVDEALGVSAPVAASAG
jgi:4-aminobutyrate aminotransferase/(S)-3-amino-2-methylpropionate transaminase